MVGGDLVLRIFCWVCGSGVVNVCQSGCGRGGMYLS